MIDGVSNAEAIPVLERLIQFTGRRHALITNNIANLSTPGFRPMDLDVHAFQSALADAVDRRRHAQGDAGGELEPDAASTIPSPESLGDNILFHDANDRDLERIMQDLVENASTFRLAADLLRSRFELINTAIRERL
jgi:flagellar basal-body rod protein FlgB